MRKVFGAVTIGQAPREDVTAEILQILGHDYHVLAAGALDGLALAEVGAMKPGPGDDVLVTRLADGTTVKVAERFIAPRVQEKVNELFAQGMRLVVLLCTGKFPAFETSGLLLRPQELIYQVAASLGRGLNVGVLCPTAAHIPQVTRQWAELLDSSPTVCAANPYEGVESVILPARKLKEEGVELVVLDCIAYTLEMQKRIYDIVGVPVILARGLVASLVKELTGT